MAKKGVAIAIETVIFIILAVVVLTVLLLFFNTQAGTAQDKFKREAERTEFCRQYVQYDPACGNRDEVTGPNRATILKGINEACGGLNVPNCQRGSEQEASPECIRNCCSIFCPSRP